MTDNITIQWNQATKEQWNALLDQAPFAAYQQCYAYGQMAEQQGATIERAVIEENGKPIGVAQFLVRRILGMTIAITIRGPVWLMPLDDASKAYAYHQLKQALPLRLPKVMLFMPEAEDHAALRQANRKQVMTGHSTAMLNLTLSEEALLAAMDGKWRNRLKAAQKGGLSVEPVGLGSDHYQWLLQKETEQARRVGYRALSSELVPIYQQYAGKNSLLILRAVHGGEVVGGVLMLIHGASATYHIGWSSEQGKQLGTHNLLLWEAIRKLKCRNIQTLDLGGITTDTASAGLARFKLGLCDHLVRLDGVYM